VALAWVMARPGVTSTLIGARTMDQLASNLAATEIQLSPAQMQRLNEVSAPALGFGGSLTQPAIRKMIFGGQQVSGWDEQA
jgi:diketogulonate reductase-like aldo/keto reductase